MQNKLWYNKPADSWTEGLPIGNGRLAAMIWGTENTDRMSLNHEWLWRGINRNRDTTPCAEHLDEIRCFLKKGDFFRATSLANVYLGGLGGVAEGGRRVDPYQPAGDLFFMMDDTKQYSGRELDIIDAVSTVKRETAAAVVTATFIAHPVYNNIIGTWQAQAGTFSGELWFSRVDDEDATYRTRIYDDEILFSCTFKDGISYIVEIRVKTDGLATKSTKGLKVENASELTVYVNIATSESGMEKELADFPAPLVDWDEVLKSHKREFSKVLNRIELDIELPENVLPADQRIKNIKAGMEDPSLMLLYFNYGRYLLASSSICGELPANLQGKWNDSINPPWECDYHFDINIQMNYWMTEAANMHECAEALIRYIERMIPHAKKAAKDLYGCRGIYLPITNDAWGRATPEACGFAPWIGAAPWIAQHIWWHYSFSGDTAFLKNRAYPIFKEIAMFFEDFLVEDENGILQIMPSQSPENRFKGSGFWPVSIGISSAMDVQLVYDALGYAIQSGKILGIDSEAVANWEGLQSKLPPFKIGQDGRLLEWDDEREEVEPGHRHLSHLYGMYPSDLFNPLDRPMQYEAAIKSLKSRLSHGGGHTGWSRAWVACLYARMGDAEGLWEHLQALIKDFATTSLLDLHPPYIFQIDGNLGAAAAVLESLVQCWGGKLHLLRALPKAWGNGRVAGIKTPGGHEFAIEWKSGKPLSVEIILGYSEEVILADMAYIIARKNLAKEQQQDNVRVGINDNDIIITGKQGSRIVLCSNQH